MAERKRILVVDDERSNLNILRDILRPAYAVILAKNGAQALERALNQQPDLILLDIMMPDMDGFEVCRRLKVESRTASIPVIFITVMGEPESETRAFDIGAVDYIPKPFNPATVEARVKTHLQLKHYSKYLEELVGERTRSLLEEIQNRKHTETKLRFSDSKLSRIINTFNGFIYSADRDAPYRIEFMNQALIRHVGDDATGGMCHQVIFGQEQPCRECSLNDVFSGKVVEFEIAHPVTGKWYYVTHSPVFSEKDEVAGRQTILIDITKRKQEDLEREEREKSLIKENLCLKTSMKHLYKFGNIVGKSRRMQTVYEKIISAAASDANVIIYGESGTGKELVAHAIHDRSHRNSSRLVSVNCGAIPKELVESEFFGYKKGAFTGADKNKAGLLEMADGGTLFLDEIGEIDLNLQVKLLRAVEDSGFSPLGGTQVVKPDIRIIAATNKNLKKLVGQGHMREDFFYRIHVIPIEIPPLRDRKEDIPLLVENFLETHYSGETSRINARLIEALTAYDWPGNIRELHNTLHRFITLNKLEMIGLDSADLLSESKNLKDNGLDLLNTDAAFGDLDTILKKIEKALIIRSLNNHNWNRSRTAASLGLTKKTLYRRMRLYGLINSDS